MRYKVLTEKVDVVQIKLIDECDTLVDAIVRTTNLRKGPHKELDTIHYILDTDTDMWSINGTSWLPIQKVDDPLRQFLNHGGLAQSGRGTGFKHRPV